MPYTCLSSLFQTKLYEQPFCATTRVVGVEKDFFQQLLFWNETVVLQRENIIWDIVKDCISVYIRGQRFAQAR